MRSHSKKDFAIYDFTEEDKAVERIASTKLSKYGKQLGSPNMDDLPMDKFKFLQAFAPDTNLRKTESTDVIYVDASTNKHDSECKTDSCHALDRKPVAITQPSSLDEIILISTSENKDIYNNRSAKDEIHECCKEDVLEAETSKSFPFSTCGILCDTQKSETSSKMNQDNANSGDDESVTNGSSSSSLEHPEIEGSFDQLELGDCWSGFKEMEDIDMAVVVSPDYVVFGDEIYGDSKLTFLEDCIRIECLDSSRGDKSFLLEWEIANLLAIDCCWSESVETAWVEVQSRAADSKEPESVNGISGILRLVFTVFGSQWLIKVQKIMSLAPRYKDIWKPEPEPKWTRDSTKLNPLFSSRYLTDFGETFVDIVYPRGDPDAVSISRRDIELLQPETFVNDTIIDFYIKYLKNKLKPDENNRFHFFNSFFFRKLADLDKNPQSVLEGREAFLRVRKWTRKVNIFEKDYVFVPVNFNLHWSLLIICHPGEIASFKDEKVDELEKVPCVLHMDSFKGSHNGLISLMQSYLWEEWKERQTEPSKDASYNFSNLRFVSLQLPQQENLYDCGLFLLHYVDLFLKEAPVMFNPFKITDFSNFLSCDWFVPAEASFKRFAIRNLLYDIFRSESQNNPPFSCSIEHQLSRKQTNEKESAIELPSSQCGMAEVDLGDINSHVDRKIELELLVKPLDSIQCNEDNVGSILMEQQFFQSRTIARSCLDLDSFSLAQFTSKGKCTMSPIEEESENFPFSEPDAEDGIAPSGMVTPKICSASFSSTSISTSDGSQSPKSPVQEQGHVDSSCETVIFEAQSSYGQNLPETDNNNKNYLSLSCQIVNTFKSSCDEETVDLTLVSSRNSVDTSACRGKAHSSPDNSVEIRSSLGICPGQPCSSQDICPRQSSSPNSPRQPCSKEMLETCIVEDSQELSANFIQCDEMKELKKQEYSFLENNEEVLECAVRSSGEILESCIVQDSQSDDNANCTKSIQEKRENVSPQGEYGDVPDCSGAFTHGDLREMCVTNYSNAASENNEHGESSGSHPESCSILPCHEFDETGSKDNALNESGDKMDSDDLIILTEPQRHKRQKLWHTGVERRRTRSLTRNSIP